MKGEDLRHESEVGYVGVEAGKWTEIERMCAIHVKDSDSWLSKDVRISTVVPLVQGACRAPGRFGISRLKQKARRR